MGEHGSTGRFDETLVQADVQRRDDRRDRHGAARDPFDDLAGALRPMGEEPADELVRALDRRAVSRQIDAVRTFEEEPKAGKVVVEVAAGRGDHARGPTHHVVAREEEAFGRQREAEMVGEVAGCVDGLNPPAAAGDFVTMVHDDVGPKVAIAGVLRLLVDAVFAGGLSRDGF